MKRVRDLKLQRKTLRRKVKELEKMIEQIQDQHQIVWVQGQGWVPAQC